LEARERGLTATEVSRLQIGLALKLEVDIVLEVEVEVELEVEVEDILVVDILSMFGPVVVEGCKDCKEFT
jgi:hypothetical protein